VTRRWVLEQHIGSIKGSYSLVITSNFLIDLAPHHDADACVVFMPAVGNRRSPRRRHSHANCVSHDCDGLCLHSPRDVRRAADHREKIETCPEGKKASSSSSALDFSTTLASRKHRRVSFQYRTIGLAWRSSPLRLSPSSESTATVQRPRLIYNAIQPNPAAPRQTKPLLTITTLMPRPAISSNSCSLPTISARRNFAL